MSCNTNEDTNVHFQTAIDGIDPDVHYCSQITKSVNCKYYNDENLRDLLEKTQNNLKILHLNIRSCQKNFSSLQYKLNKMKSKFDVICLSET